MLKSADCWLDRWRRFKAAVQRGKSRRLFGKLPVAVLSPLSCELNGAMVELVSCFDISLNPSWFEPPL